MHPHLGKVCPQGLEKARTTHSQGAPKYLDVPDGPLARGANIEMSYGSRREALAQRRNEQKAADVVPQGAVPEPNNDPSAFPVPVFPLVTSRGGNGSNPQKSGKKRIPSMRVPETAEMPKNRGKPPHSRIPKNLP
jgi:hypothetical protein